jgi:hypothetical protein
MVSLEISPEARNDLAEIKSFSQELCNPQAAVNLAFEITKKYAGYQRFL